VALPNHAHTLFASRYHLLHVYCTHIYLHEHSGCHLHVHELRGKHAASASCRSVQATALIPLQIFLCYRSSINLLRVLLLASTHACNCPCGQSHCLGVVLQGIELHMAHCLASISFRKACHFARATMRGFTTLIFQGAS
jgi:hypothetical protein